MQPETVGYLANFEDALVRALANASNPYTSTTNLDLLSKHKDQYVRYEVAKNPNTLPHTLEWLSCDSKQYIRMAVTSNKNTSMHVLLSMSKNDEDTYVRCDAEYFYNKRMKESIQHTTAMMLKEMENKKPTKP